MWLFFAIALLFIAFSLLFWHKNDNIIAQEWLGSAGIAFILAIIMACIAYYGTAGDIETWSGTILKAVHYPRWVSEETRDVTETDANGNTHTRTETYYETHPEYWEAETSVGDYRFQESRFKLIASKFGGTETERPWKPNFHHGDRNIYVAYNKTDYAFPVTSLRSWINKIKGAGPTAFSFQKVPKGSAVFQWPENNDFMYSERLLGLAADDISLYDFDCLNSRLGFSEKVNIILIGFYRQPASIAQLQQAHWLGGKKNDLVLCYNRSTTNGAVDWTYVFGWTDKNLVKKNLETLLLTHQVDNNILSLIEKEVRSHYEIKDWSQFDYITVRPATRYYIIYFVLLLLLEAGYWYWAHHNEYGASSTYHRTPFTHYRWR